MNTTVMAKEGGARECICLRCGIEAEWTFANQEETMVEIRCADCGIYEMSKTDFDAGEADISTQDEMR